MLSRVAEAFRDRIQLADRLKDGLTYKNAFDGREAVDKIAYIIKTTDRNLALLLGRALDAQKFFHDVTYDHRLRDSANELYQFRTKLPSPFVSGELPNVNATSSELPSFQTATESPVVCSFLFQTHIQAIDTLFEFRKVNLHRLLLQSINRVLAKVHSVPMKLSFLQVYSLS